MRRSALPMVPSCRRVRGCRPSEGALNSDATTAARHGQLSPYARAMARRALLAVAIAVAFAGCAEDPVGRRAAPKDIQALRQFKSYPIYWLGPKPAVGRLGIG